MAHGRRWKVLVVAYVLACLAVLDYAMSARDMHDTDVVVALAMLALTFPAGCVVGALLGAAAYVLVHFFDITLPGGAGTNGVLIVLFAVVGYLQWFVVVPRVWRASR